MTLEKESEIFFIFWRQTTTVEGQNKFAYPTAYPKALEGQGFNLIFRLSAWNAWWAHQGSNLGPAD